MSENDGAGENELPKVEESPIGERDSSDEKRETKRQKIDPLEADKEKSDLSEQSEVEDSSTAEPLSADIEEKEKFMRQLKLKSILKENHRQPVTCIQFNFTVETNSNLLGTVGANQANIYDSTHFGDNVDLMMHFVNQPLALPGAKTKKDRPLNVHTCVWIRENGSEKELKDDIYLAIAGEDALVQIISMKRSQVIAVLQGHTMTINALASHPTRPELLLSGSNDGKIILWNIHESKELHRWNNSCTSLAFSPSGDRLLYGNPNGSISEISFKNFLASGSLTFETRSIKLTEHKHSQTVDCIRFVDDERVISKSFEGYLLLWNVNTSHVTRKFRVPNGWFNGTRLFDISRDKVFLCSGNAEGVVFIWNILTGKLIRKLEHRRSRGAIYCCAFSGDGKSVYYTSKEAHIWRWTYREDVPVEQKQEEPKEGEEKVEKDQAAGVNGDQDSKAEEMVE